jgi:hypothetical protein
MLGFFLSYLYTLLFDCHMQEFAILSYPCVAKVSWGRKECPFIPLSFVFTHPRSKPASLAETASLEGIEGVVEGSAFVRLFEAVDRLLASQTKDSKLAISTRAKNTLFRMAKPPKKLCYFAQPFLPQSEKLSL